MNKYRNYEKEKFGLLTVLECMASSDGTNRGGLWLCKCKCGKTITLQGYSLHNRKSCGCLITIAAKERGKKFKNPDKKAITTAYHKYKNRVDSPIDKEEWVKITADPCYYCSRDEELRDIEEADSVLIPCCPDCMKMRKGFSHREFIENIVRIVTVLKAIQ